MLNTLRPFTAGAIAVIGAAAVITAPPDTAPRTHDALGARSTAEVALTAWQNPFVALLDSGEMAENYVFGGYYNGAEGPTPGAGEANWPSAGFDQTGGEVLNFLLTQQPALGNYFYVGFLENFAAGAYLPALQQWQINVADNISVVLSGLNRAARDLATGQWAEAGETVREAFATVLANVAARTEALVAALPQILKTFAGAVIGGTQFLAAKTAAVVKEVVARLSTGNLEGAWNAAVDGTLGPSGITGALLNLNTGAGVQTGPILNPASDIPTNFVPSMRTAVQAAQWTLRGALEAKPTVAAPPPAAAAIGETPTAATAAPETLDVPDAADAAPDTVAALAAGIGETPTAVTAAPETLDVPDAADAAPDTVEALAADTAPDAAGAAGRAVSSGEDATPHRGAAARDRGHRSADPAAGRHRS